MWTAGSDAVVDAGPYAAWRACSLALRRLRMWCRSPCRFFPFDGGEGCRLRRARIRAHSGLHFDDCSAAVSSVTVSRQGTSHRWKISGLFPT